MGALKNTAALELSALRKCKPDQWRRRIKAAFKKAGGYVRGPRGAAKLLGVTENTVFVWLREDEVLRQALERPGRGARRGKREPKKPEAPQAAA